MRVKKIIELIKNECSMWDYYDWDELNKFCRESIEFLIEETIAKYKEAPEYSEENKQ